MTPSKYFIVHTSNQANLCQRLQYQIIESKGMQVVSRDPFFTISIFYGILKIEGELGK